MGGGGLACKAEDDWFVAMVNLRVRLSYITVIRSDNSIASSPLSGKGDWVGGGGVEW